jgi:hypothetical protein
VLVDDADPDYPPLVDACDAARRQGGVVIWCHNGKGMEAPVAAALGKLDAFNLFDPYWMDPEWDVWYALLNCGLRLPASTGSDWFICSSNRVYVQTGAGSEAEDTDHEHTEHGAATGHPNRGEDSRAATPDAGQRASHPQPAGEEAGAEGQYRRWLAGLQAGRSFITNGPALFLTVEGRGPGESLPAPAARAALTCDVRWQAAQPVHRVELVRNGRVVERATWPEGRREGTLRWRIAPGEGGGEWVAPPVQVGSTARPATPEARESARFFVGEIRRALEWIGSRGRYREPAHRERMAALFDEAQAFYRAIAG